MNRLHIICLILLSFSLTSDTFGQISYTSSTESKSKAYDDGRALTTLKIEAGHNIDSSIKSELKLFFSIRGKHHFDTATQIVTPFRIKTSPKNMLLFVLNKSIMAPDPGPYSYNIWSDGKLLTSNASVNFSDETRVIHVSDTAIGDYYILLFDLIPHRYIVDVFDPHAKPCVSMTVTNYGALRLLGIYKNSAIPQVKEALVRSKKNLSKTPDAIPPPDLEPGFAVGNIDTIKSDGHLYFVPQTIVASSSDSLLFLFNELGDSDCFEYLVTAPNAEYDLSKGWQRTAKGNNIVELSHLRPGSFQLHVRFYEGPMFPGYSHSYTFTVLDATPWYKTVWFSCLLVAVGCLLLFIAYKRGQRARQKEREQQLKTTRLQLQVYRSQLNPHFIFNALSSIQALVNKHDEDNANRYLTDFSSLLRMTLDQQKTEFWTLQEEIELLNKYVSLEQLRFRFQYEVSVDKAVAPENVSFPAMLLQPLVENAIKRGISGNYENGRLSIIFDVHGNDLQITVGDNGRGFDTTTKPTAGHGLYLTRERITSLNELDKQKQLSLEIKSNAQGTVASLYCKHYLNS